MSNTILACRRICCGRKANTRSINSTVNQKSSPNKSNSNKIPLSLSPENEKNSNIFSPSDQLIQPNLNIQLTNESNTMLDQLYKTS